MASSPRPMCGATNALPADPGTLMVGCCPTPHPAGGGESVSERISRTIQELKRLEKAAKAANSQINDEDIKRAIDAAFALSAQAAPLGYDVSGLKAEAVETMRVYVQRAIQEVKQTLDDYRKDSSATPDDDVIAPMKDAIRRIGEAQRIGVNDASSLASVGGALGEFIHLRVKEMQRSIAEVKAKPGIKDDWYFGEMRCVIDLVHQGEKWGLDCTIALAECGGAMGYFIKRKVENVNWLVKDAKVDSSVADDEITDAMKAVIRAVEEGKKLGCDSSSDLSEVGAAGQFLFTRKVNRMKDLLEKVKNRVISITDSKVKEAASDLVGYEKSLRKLASSVPNDKGMLDAAKALLSAQEILDAIRDATAP